MVAPGLPYVRNYNEAIRYIRLSDLYGRSAEEMLTDGDFGADDVGIVQRAG
jgi:hypothetical protein